MDQSQILADHQAWLDSQGQTGVRADFTQSVFTGNFFTGANLARAIFRQCQLRKVGFQGAVLRGAEFHECDMREADFAGADLAHGVLKECDSREAKFAGGSFSITLLQGCDMREADFAGVDLSQSFLHGCDLREANFADSNLSPSFLYGCDLQMADFGGGNLSLARFQDCDLSLAKFAGADLSEAELDEVAAFSADMQGAILVNARLTQLQLQQARLNDAILTGAVLRHIDMTGADLTRAQLNEAALDDVNLASATFVDADLSQTRIENSILAAADLREADLTGVVFRQPMDLTGADFRESTLAGADFGGARLTNANFENTDLREARDFLLDATDVRRARFRVVRLRWYEEFSRGRFLVTRWLRALGRKLGFGFDCLPSDRWSVLRQSYGGPRYVLLLVSLAIFALPYVGRAAWFAAVGNGEKAVVRLAAGHQMVEETDTTVTFQPIQLPPNPLVRQLDPLFTLADTSEKILKKIPVSIRELLRKYRIDGLFRVWEHLTGQVNEWKARIMKLPSHTPKIQFEKRSVGGLLLKSDHGKIAVCVAVLLIIYNAGVFLLVSCVAPLRDEEERSGFSPAYADYAGSWLTLEWFHRRIINPLSYLTWIVLAWNAIEIIRHPTYVLQTAPAAVSEPAKKAE